MKRINTTDILAVGLIAIAIYILTTTRNLFGIIGAVIVLIAELVYLWQTKVRKRFG